MSSTQKSTSEPLLVSNRPRQRKATSLPVSPGALLFEPKGSSNKQACDNVPRYLFRVFDRYTAGHTDIRGVSSPAWLLQNPDDKKSLFDREPGQGESLLWQHLKWTESHEATCNLISWTSSLPFAIRYGLYRHGKTKYLPNAGFAEIFLLVLDTREFPRGAFIKDLAAIEAFGDSPGDLLENIRTLRTDMGYYFGEYLSQGRLDIEGRCAKASMQGLIDHGLFALYPDLGDRSSWANWAKPAKADQTLIYYAQDVAEADKAEVRRAISIAQGCFGERWALPLSLMLLSMRPRREADGVILGAFKALFTGAEICNGSISQLNLDPKRLPEVQQFGDLVGSLRTETDPDVLAESMAGLHVGSSWV